MNEDPNPRVRAGQTLLVLLLVFFVISFIAIFYYKDIDFIIYSIIFLCIMFYQDEKIEAIKEEDGNKREK